MRYAEEINLAWFCCTHANCFGLLTYSTMPTVSGTTLHTHQYVLIPTISINTKKKREKFVELVFATEISKYLYRGIVIKHGMTATEEIKKSIWRGFCCSQSNTA